MPAGELDRASAREKRAATLSRRRLLRWLLSVYGGSFVPSAWVQPAAAADRDGFAVLSALLVGQRVMDPGQTARIYAALATEPHFAADVQILLAMMRRRQIDLRQLQTVLDAEHSPVAALPRKIVSAWYLGIIGSGAGARCISYETALNAASIADVLKPPSYAYGVYGSWTNKPA